MRTLTADFDRATMAYTLGAHIILASLGMSLPIIMVIAEYLGLRKRDAYYSALSRRLSIAMVVLFAVGTASGIAVASELLVLFPPFMSVVGKVSILPFYIEVFAFFGESILLGIYVYSWDKIASRRLHMLMGSFIAVFANLSGVLIIMVNSWMNTPNGFNIEIYRDHGLLTNIDPLAVFMTNSTPIEELHALVGTLFAGAALIMGYFAFRLLKARSPERKRYFRGGLKISFVINAILVWVAIIGGSLSMSMLYKLQPVKYAAIDANMFTRSHAGEKLFGLNLHIPSLQSILATGHPSGVVPGLNSYPSSIWPPLWIHDTFDAMLVLGTLVGLLLLAGVFAAVLRHRKKENRGIIGKLVRIFHPYDSRLMLSFLAISSLLTLFTMEDGWVTDEVGRQPWIIYDVMRTSAAANTSMIVIPMALGLMAFYVIIYVITFVTLKRIFARRNLETDIQKESDRIGETESKPGRKYVPGKS